MTETERQMAELEAVLAELVATGLVLEREGKDAQTRYEVNPWKVSEIRALLLKEWGRDPAYQGPTAAHSPVGQHITQENPLWVLG